MDGATLRPIFCCERIEKITVKKARWLEEELNEKEVLAVIHGCGGDKAPGPNANMLAERDKKVVGNVVGDVQNALIKGRYILDGVLIGNETMEFLKKNKEKGLIFKVDFEKAYDSINWR
ncbi:hypothetical protein Tco_0566684 [Tanacetum coccineum]